MTYAVIAITSMLAVVLLSYFANKYAESVVKRFERNRDISGVEITVPMIYTGCMSAFLCLVIFIFLKWFFIAVVLPILLFVGIEYYLRKLSAKRLKAFQEQLPDTLDAISLSLKSGASFIKAMETASENLHAPMATEMKQVIADYRFGVPLSQCLHNVGYRVESSEFELVTCAIDISMSIGGSLSNTFSSLAVVVREKIKMEGKVAAITAMGKSQGWVVGLSPIAVGVFLYTQEPEAMMKLFTTWYGLLCTVAMVLMMIAAIFTIKKIVTVDV